MPSKYGFGNTRKKSPYRMGKAHYGVDQKNPIMKKEEETLEIKMKPAEKIYTQSPTSGLEFGSSRDVDYTAREHTHKTMVKAGIKSPMDTFNVPEGSVYVTGSRKSKKK